MKFLAVLLSITTFCSTSLAEPKAYVDMGWFHREIVVDGKKLNPSFFGGFPDLVEAMKSNPEARAYAETASTQWLWLNITSTATLVGLIYLINRPDWRLADSGTLDSYFYLLLGGILTNSILQFSAMANENRAINAYNGVKVSDNSLRLDGFGLAPVSGGGAAGVLSWSF